MSATAVPIPPTSRKALITFWLGIALLIGAGIALAWFGTREVWAKYGAADSYLSDIAAEEGITPTKSGLLFKQIRGGEGPSPTDKDVAIVEIEGRLRDGTVFQPRGEGPMPVDGVIPGFSEALKKMQKGGEYKIWIPPELGYGEEDQTNPQSGEIMVPGGSVLEFDVNMKDFMSREKFEEAMAARMKAMQEAQGGGAPAGPPPTPGN